MSSLNDPKFYEWLKEKNKINPKTNQGFEPVPLYIHIDAPKSPKTSTEIDFTVETTIIQF